MLPRNFDFAGFVSFAQADRDLDLEPFTTFLNELDAVFKRFGHRNRLDQTYFLINNRHSGDFRDALELGKKRAVCLLSLYSPNYWDSPECASERTYFFDRNLRTKYRTQFTENHIELFGVPWIYRATPHGRPVAEKIFPDSVSEEIRRLSFFRGERDFPTVYNHGLLATLANARTVDEGKAYARALATKMSEVIEQFANSTLLPANPGRKGTLFVLAATPGQVEEQITRLVDSKNIQSGDPVRLEESRRLRIEAYRFGGGADWHPFAPTNRSRSIRTIVETIVGNHVQELASPAEPPAPLPGIIADAEDQKEYVIVVVDPWSLFHFGRLKAALADLDEKNFRNCMVLIVKGPTDSIYEAHAAEIETYLQGVFKRSKATSMLYREISTEQALKSAVRDLFHRVRIALGIAPARAVDTSGPAEPTQLSNAVGG